MKLKFRTKYRNDVVNKLKKASNKYKITKFPITILKCLSAIVTFITSTLSNANFAFHNLISVYFTSFLCLHND